MSKLSFEALQQKAAATDQQELLTSVSGGTFGDCHPCPVCELGNDFVDEGGHNLGHTILHWILD